MVIGIPANKNRKDRKSEEGVGRVRFPNADENEQFALVTQLLGANQVKAMCQDGKERLCRIPGKMRKRVWIRVNDVVIVKLWEFQPAKADIIWRFLGNQVEWLKRKGALSALPI